VQLAGQDHIVTDCHFINGYDRAVATTVGQVGGAEQAQDVRISDNYVRDLSDGSAFSVNGPNMVVSGNQVEGSHRSLVRVSTPDNVVINGNSGHQETQTNNSGIEIEGGGDDYVIISNNRFEGYGSNGILGRDCYNVKIANNHIAGVSDQGINIIKDGRQPKDVVVSNNTVYNAGLAGFDVRADYCRIVGNHIEQCGSYGGRVREATNSNIVAHNSFVRNQQDGVNDVELLIDNSDERVFLNYIDANPSVGIRENTNASPNDVWYMFNVIKNATTDYDTTIARSIIDGNSINNGDPANNNYWQGNADLAYERGVVVWDTSTSPATPYRADPSGNWVAI
jgi:hypothetical protein